MSQEAPILQQIHDRFDTYDRYPYTDHSVISTADINSSKKGYRITTYPGRLGTAYDGFVIDVQAEGGLFGNSLSRVETSRDYGGLMFFSVDQGNETEDGALTVTGTVSNPARREGLLLPGDEGFELFEELHQQVQTLQPVIAETVALVQDGVKPEVVVYKHKAGSTSYDYDKLIVTSHQSTLLDVKDRSGNQVKVELDGTREIPGKRAPSILLYEEPKDIVYRAGKADVRYGRAQQTRNLDIVTLTAFSGVQGEVQKLFKPRPTR